MKWAYLINISDLTESLVKSLDRDWCKEDTPTWRTVAIFLLSFFVMGLTQKSIQLWGSTSGDLKSVEYSFITGWFWHGVR